MYEQYFQLREVPFSIAPDPAFLYLSAHHQEALGHLLYGTGQFGGFVQLTGEVGTGKTTIVRALLAQRLDNVDVAMIHNPRQDEVEFVQAVCDDLGIDYPKASGPRLKTLVDALNTHLLATHAAGRRTVLVIDEAQNLAPEVLEQVRLLTNLETDKEKLLRILLVGQPELAATLARPDLRQLASRITARYQLQPLSEAETRGYIEHRLRIAGGNPGLFSSDAARAIYRCTKGVPRAVNILCDRALLGAYALQRALVTPDIVERANDEVLGRPPRKELPGMGSLRLAGVSCTWAEALLFGLGLLAAAILLVQLLHRPSPMSQAAPPVHSAPHGPAASRTTFSLHTLTGAGADTDGARRRAAMSGARRT